MGRLDGVYKISCPEGVGRWLAFLKVQAVVLFAKSFCVLPEL